MVQSRSRWPTRGSFAGFMSSLLTLGMSKRLPPATARSNRLRGDAHPLDGVCLLPEGEKVARSAGCGAARSARIVPAGAE